jgi:ABC-type multidrug transport system permease subunit
MLRWRPFRELVLARIREFYREPAVIFWVHGFPLFLAIGLGIAFSGGAPGSAQDMGRSVPAIAIEDGAGSAQSELLARQLEAAGLHVHLADPDECRRLLTIGKVTLVIRPGDDGLVYIYDPARPDARLARFEVDDVVQRARAGSRAMPVRESTLEEPGSRYIDYLIPGLMGLNLMGGGLWGVGFVIVEMRVRRLLKFFLATPMRRGEFLLAILTSRLIFIVPEMLLLVLAGRFLFGVPVRGSVGALILLIVVGGAAFAGLGLLIASRTEKTQTASGLINLLMLPMWMLSGTFFSYDRFPPFLQPFIQALPLTPLNDGLRAVMLEGAGLGAIAPSLGILAGWGVLGYFFAVRLFRWVP